MFFDNTRLQGTLSVVKKLLSERMAFTLAEVLIVLGIIGLIADMTIPTLARNIQTQQLEAAFKTAYSSMSQAIGMMKVNEGQVYGLYGPFDNGNPNGFSFVFSKYFKNAVFAGGNNLSERWGYDLFSFVVACAQRALTEKDYFKNLK